MYPELFAVLSPVIGIAWLTVLPVSSHWCGFDLLMAERVETSIAALEKLD